MMKISIFGAGPAGLAAASEAVKSGLSPTIFEAAPTIGGIARTVDYKGFHFDLGGHRFFTKFDEVKAIWQETLGPQMLMRPRLSRIYYDKKFFYYPLRPMNALVNLGLGQALAVLSSYLAAQIKPYKNPRNLEQWVSNRFGRRLYRIFFKTYTEKVWGMPCSEIQADWAAQRIKSLSLGKAVLDAFGLRRKGSITTLIDEFLYPRKGPGQMWEAMRQGLEKAGGQVNTGSEVVQLRMENEHVVGATVRTNGRLEELTADQYISSMPLRDLIGAIEPKPRSEVVEAAQRLKYRDFFTVGLILRAGSIFPDNWIYIHSPEVLVGRIQNFKNWSPDMVADEAMTNLGMEYFCFESDEIWSRPDRELINLALREAIALGFAGPGQFEDGVVIRSPKSYPVYDPGYQENIRIVKDYLASVKNLQTIGRNGLHRYNNMDHSMMTGIFAVRNLMGADLSVWDVNDDTEYHEIKQDNSHGR